MNLQQQYNEEQSILRYADKSRQLAVVKRLVSLRQWTRLRNKIRRAEALMLSRSTLCPKEEWK